MTAVDLSKQQAVDADRKAIQQTNFTANLEKAENTKIYFILEEAKEIVLDFSQETVKIMLNNLTYISTKLHTKIV